MNLVALEGVGEGNIPALEVEPVDVAQEGEGVDGDEARARQLLLARVGVRGVREEPLLPPARVPRQEKRRKTTTVRKRKSFQVWSGVRARMGRGERAKTIKQERSESEAGRDESRGK